METIVECKFCLLKFRTDEALLKHHETSKLCEKYKNILFTCTNCNFGTVGYKNIEKHNPACCQVKNQSDKERISQLEKSLEKEKIKNGIYRKIIEDNINIRLDDFIVGDSILYDKVPETTTKPPEIKIVTKKTAKKSDKNELEQIDDIIFKNLIDDTEYNDNLNNLKRLKASLLSNMSFKDYLEMVNNHLKIMKNIFTKKKMSDYKINSLLSSSLTPVDKKILTFGNYTGIQLEIDDIQKIEKSLRNIEKPKMYEPYKKEDIINKFLNYTTSLFTIKQLIEIHLFNNNKHSNLIYLPLAKSLDDDPYSFYFLENISDIGMKNWKMDCRLEEFTNFFVNNIRSYLVDLFRQIYRNTFNDNDYRPNFKNKLYINECEQLIQNLLLINQPMKFNLVVRNVVKNKCSHKNDSKDNFKLTCDDLMQKQRFKEETDDPEELNYNMRLLFDTIDDEQVDMLIREYSL